MTADAVILDNPLPGFFDKDYLWLCPHSKNGSVAQAVFGFEIVFIEEIIMWNMAIVTICLLPV